MIIRFEARSESGRVVIVEVKDGGVHTPTPHHEIDVATSELWRVELERAYDRSDRRWKEVLIEVGSWPIVPATRAEARFV